MAQKPNIPSQYLPQPCGTSPRLTIFTNSTDALYLIVTFIRPKRKPRFKTIRGLTYECGRQWEFLDAVCIPQINIPTQEYHIFPLPSANIGDCLWYTLATACRRDEAASFSPPIEYCYKACPIPGAFCQVQRVPATLLGSDFSVAYRDVIAGDPAVRVNDLTLKALAGGGYAFTATATARADPNAAGTWTGEMYFESASEGEFGVTGPYTTDRGQEISITAVGSMNLPVNDLISVKVRRTAGTNLLQIPASLNTSAQWSMAPM